MTRSTSRPTPFRRTPSGRLLAVTGQLAPQLAPEADAEELELSVVIPCLNEAETLAGCVDVAVRTLEEHGIAGEVIVADNGSTDGSRELAVRHGARVVPVEERGYGSALMGGIAAARGRYVVMADADQSYDFREIPSFLAKLREGFDLVQGCRLPRGGGRVMPGAMPVLHRWWGNPMFSLLARWWFRAPIHDVHCGMRAFSRRFFATLDQHCTGMEFASEMIIKATLLEARIAEVPVTLHPDRRTLHPPHLRTFRDGWRHLRFYLMYSPRWLFLLPGAALIASGVAGAAIAARGTTIGGVTFDVHTLLVASLAVVWGYQAIIFAALTKIFAIGAGMLPTDRRMTALFRIVTLERGLIAGLGMMGAGVLLLIAAVLAWRATGYGPMDYQATMRIVIPGVALTTLGMQTVLSSFFMSILGLRRR